MADDYGILEDELEIISGSIFLFASGALSDDTTAISSSIPQIVAISCSSNINNKLTKLTTQQAYGIITISSGSSDVKKDTKLVLRYVSDTNDTDRIYESSDDTLNHVLGGINTNIVYVNIPVQNNDDPFAVALKTIAALTSSLGYNTHYSASLIESSENLISFSASLGENLTIGSSFKIRPTGSSLHVSGGFLVHSLNSGSVAVPDFSGTAVQVGGMEVGDTFVIGGGVTSEVFSWNIVQSGSGNLNQPFYEGKKITASANLGMKLDPQDKTSAFITGSNRSASMYFSGSGQMGFGTTNPKTDFDIRANKFYVQQRLDTKGIFINNDGDLESFNRTTSGSSTGSEFIMKYSRGGVGSITPTLINIVMGAGTISADADRGEIDEFLNSLDPETLNEILIVGEDTGLLSTRPQTGDVLGALRWVADSGSITQDVFDFRKDGEAARIQTTVADGGDDGFTGNIQFFTATAKDAAPTEIVRIAADGNVHVTGSVKVSGDIEYRHELNVHTTSSGNISASGDIIASGDVTGSNLLITSSGQVVVGVQNNGNTLSKWEWHRNDVRKWVIYNDGRTSPSHIQDGLHFKAGINTDADANYINMVLRPDQGALFYGNVTSSGTISASGNIIAPKFIGQSETIVQHSFYAAPDAYGVNNLINGKLHYGWADRAWVKTFDKADLDGTGFDVGEYAHHGVPIVSDLTNLQVVASLRPNASGVTSLAVYLYSGSAPAGSTDNTNHLGFICSASASTMVQNAFNDVYITGSTGYSINAGEHLYVFVESSQASSHIKGTYTVRGERI